MKVRVELLSRYKQLNRGEVAGFPQEEAEELISRGIARRVPQATQPLVAAALQLDDPQIQQLARAIENLGHLEEREAQQARLRADIATIEKQEARALSLGERLPADAAEQKRLVVERLLKVEKEIQILTEQYEPLLIELQQLVQGHVRRKSESIVTRNLGPVLRELATLVTKAARMHGTLAPDLKALDELRALAVTAELEPGSLDELVAGVVREITGADTLVSPTTARVSLSDLGTLLYGLAVAQQRAQVPA